MPPKRKSEAFTSNLLWDKVSANTLRLVCRDMANPSVGQLSKLAMISFLFDVEQHGVDNALENISKSSKPADPPKPSPPAAPTTPSNPRPRTTSLKRKKAEPAPEEDEAESEAPEKPEEDNDGLPYNTRHKGQKRVRVTAPPLPKMSSVRRKSTASRTPKRAESVESEEAPGETSVTPVKRARGRPKKSTATAAPAAAPAASGSAVKRGRGRPKKSAASEVPAKKAASSGRQIFDGIELKRARTRETNEDEDADGEVDEDALALPSGETSSLGSSNKENNPELAFTAQEDAANGDVVVTAQMSLVDAINLANNNPAQTV